MAKTKQKWTKKHIVGLVLLLVFAVLTIVGIVFHGNIFSEESWFRHPKTGIGVLDAALAIVPRLVESVYVIFVTLLVLYTVGFFMRRIFKGSPRRVTIGRLALSILTVVIWVVGVIAVLAVWGVNVIALSAGAVSLTLVIGLGMQNLIADVIAGFFLVCDGTLQVGDIVTIDGWRGTVQEIGIRNTKLVNYSGDIRVANNSTIKVFINQSREISYPTVTISITYEEDVRRVEKLFAENIEKIKENLPYVIGYPEYKGVTQLSDSSVDLLFGASCKEDDFYQVQRDMNRALRIFFMENDIAIPFPQVDIHTPDADPQGEK